MPPIDTEDDMEHWSDFLDTVDDSDIEEEEPIGDHELIVDLDKVENGDSFNVHVGDQILLTGFEKPSTGFEWILRES